MDAIGTTTRSARTERLRHLAPRTLAYAFVGILCLVGLRTIVAGPPEPARAKPVVTRGPDFAVHALAESFTRAYLTWDDGDSEARDEALAPFLTNALTGDGGVSLASGSSQEVKWVSVTGVRRNGEITTVTVAADTTNGMTYLSVPVARDERGFLYVAGYPALVGPPVTNRDARAVQGDDVKDPGLETVAGRALTNYLAGARPNLLADLTPDAVVSLPRRRLRLTTLQSLTWVTTNHRVAAVVNARDERETAWTLRYELEVHRSDRWYVRSVDSKPTFQQGGK